MPTFALFKSDRASTDQDAEAQDPLKAAIREAIKEVEPLLQQVRNHVENETRKIAEKTIEKIREMDPTIANTLDPIISTKKWDSLFTTSITGDDGIPLNKRGSGVKRLVLLNFFRAKAEKEATVRNAPSVIYAIEEPETSQHPRNQRLLLGALQDLSNNGSKQVILTTHTPMLARYLPETSLRFVTTNVEGRRTILNGSPETSGEIARSLGILADHNVKLFIAVEGAHDISFLKAISSVLALEGENVPDLAQLELDGQIVFFPLGGSNLAVWASRLSPLKRPEFHLCDRDIAPPAPPKYDAYLKEVARRQGCTAAVTNKREMENYIHYSAIEEAYAAHNITIELDGPFGDFDDVPSLVAAKVSIASGGRDWSPESDELKRKARNAKAVLNDAAVRRMTGARLTEVDKENEVRGWLSAINSLIANSDA